MPVGAREGGAERRGRRYYRPAFGVVAERRLGHRRGGHRDHECFDLALGEVQFEARVSAGHRAIVEGGDVDQEASANDADGDVADDYQLLFHRRERTTVSRPVEKLWITLLSDGG